MDFDGVQLNIYNMIYWPQAYHDGPSYSGGYTVYLVNVTSTDFRVAYLYLNNGVGQFQMYYYDYDVGQVVEYYFTGQQSAGAHTHTFTNDDGSNCADYLQRTGGRISYSWSRRCDWNDETTTDMASLYVFVRVAND